MTARQGFIIQHIERIQSLELIQTEMWKEYRSATDTMDRVNILEKIAGLQQYISRYYEATQTVISSYSSSSPKTDKLY